MAFVESSSSTPKGFFSNIHAGRHMSNYCGIKYGTFAVCPAGVTYVNNKKKDVTSHKPACTDIVGFL